MSRLTQALGLAFLIAFSSWAVYLMLMLIVEAAHHWQAAVKLNGTAGSAIAAPIILTLAGVVAGVVYVSDKKESK